MKKELYDEERGKKLDEFIKSNAKEEGSNLNLLPDDWIFDLFEARVNRTLSEQEKS